MIKSLIFCTLINIFYLIPVTAQEENRVQEDSVKSAGYHIKLQDFVNQNSAGRMSGYAGLMVIGSQTGYYGGLSYAIKNNQAIRFEFMYASGNNYTYQPGFNMNSRILAPSVLYQYSIIGKPGFNSPYGYQAGSIGFSLYVFTGIGTQFYSNGSNLNVNEARNSNLNSKGYSFVVPLGIGMNYKFDNNMTIGLEIRGNFHVSNGEYANPYSYGMNSYQNSYGQWGYPGVMFGQFRNGPGF